MKRGIEESLSIRVACLFNFMVLDRVVFTFSRFKVIVNFRGHSSDDLDLDNIRQG